jgi:hypothetical protein
MARLGHFAPDATVTVSSAWANRVVALVPASETGTDE